MNARPLLALLRGISVLAFITSVSVVALSSCGHSAGKADAFQTTCGYPGSAGNEQGVGKFCSSLSDCANNDQSPICAILGSPTTHFCTHTCVGDGGVGQCGTNATCTCQGGPCGCVPNTCLIIHMDAGSG
jgi:hypothetical protein